MSDRIKDLKISDEFMMKMKLKKLNWFESKGIEEISNESIELSVEDTDERTNE